MIMINIVFRMILALLFVLVVVFFVIMIMIDIVLIMILVLLFVLVAVFLLL